jgi:hypothetical protein
MGEGVYVFHTHPGLDNKLYDSVDHFVINTLDRVKVSIWGGGGVGRAWGGVYVFRTHPGLDNKLYSARLGRAAEGQKQSGRTTQMTVKGR